MTASGFSVEPVTPVTGVTGKCYGCQSACTSRSIDLSNANANNGFLSKRLCKLLPVSFFCNVPFFGFSRGNE